MNDKKRTIYDNIIEGFMVLLGVAEIANLSALFLHLSFHTCANIMAVLLSATILAFLCISFLIKRGKCKERKERRFLKLCSVYPILFFLVFLLLTLQIVWNVWMHLPNLTGDITVETVQTMLGTNTIYQINPMTGLAYQDGMPMRLKILVLPTLYASICRWTGLSAVAVCFRLIPTVCIILSYLVYSRWAVFLFPGEGKKQAMFMLFTALVYQFGSYAMAMDSFLLFFQGYQPAAFRAAVILPYALLCCFKGKWRSVLLCALAEACIVWTLYGLGYTVLIAVIVFCLQKIPELLANRRKKA